MKSNYLGYDCTIDYSSEAVADICRSGEDIRRYSGSHFCEHSKPSCNSNQNISCDETISVIGNSISFSACEEDSEIKADVIIGYRKSVRVWGQVKDCDGNPVGCAYVKLLKVTRNGLVGIAHTTTDCLGFYQFDICLCDDGYDFTIVVGKASTGPERSITSGLRGLNCNPCDEACSPCK